MQNSRNFVGGENCKTPIPKGDDDFKLTTCFNGKSIATGHPKLVFFSSRESPPKCRERFRFREIFHHLPKCWFLQVKKKDHQKNTHQPISSRRWFEICFSFSPLLGEDEPNLTSIFFRSVCSTTN